MFIKKFFEQKRKEDYFQAKTEDLITQLKSGIIDRKGFDEEMNKLFAKLEK